MPVAVLINGIIAGLPAAIQLGAQIATLIEKQKAGQLSQADADAAVAQMNASISAWDNRPGSHA